MDFTTSGKTFKVTMRFLIFFYLIFISRECKGLENNPCISKETCGKCIQVDPRCAWCSQEDFTKRKIPRCNFVLNLEEMNCTDLVYPSSSMKNILNLALSVKGTNAESVVQIKPQENGMKLRPNFPKTFSMEFRQTVDYPVDLYYLLDVSPSMKQHKSKLDALGEEFANKIGTVSSDFRIGVGSFLDKVAASSSKTQPTKFNNPVFRHQLTLGRRTILFQSKVVNSRQEVDAFDKSSNFGSPEGTLDAIMQAIVCNEVGWRPDSKKLLVIATGNDFHFAGDGKLKGIIHPNDGSCHLDNDGYHTQQDYPSLSQINWKIKQHNITLIFAVTENLLDVYANLSSRLMGSATGELANTSSIMELIEKEYKAMCSSIEMTDSAQSSGNIEISYNSSCLDGKNRERNVCTNIKPEDTVVFNVTLKFSSCPEKRQDRKQEIVIKPVGRIANLTLHLEMICECDCKKPGEKEQTGLCSGRGTFECGVCICHNNTYGTECECDGIENQTHWEDSECRRGKEERLCSSRGECRCGKCFCSKADNPDEMYYGKYCQCSNFSCRQANSKICNGHGTCDCDRCVCDEGWSGPYCTCGNTTENCLGHGDGVMCSGHGRCYCGSCTCDETYYGQFCEDCPSCESKCKEYSTCVKCVLSAIDEEMPEEDCTEFCEMKNFEVVELVDRVEVNETLQERTCSIPEEDGCQIFFKYAKSDNKSIIIHAQRSIECPAPADVVAIVAGTIGSIVIAGLILLLMWKFLTYVHDRREFAKFEQERERARWDSGQNPIFIEPSRTFENPAYKRS